MWSSKKYCFSSLSAWEIHRTRNSRRHITYQHFLISAGIWCCSCFISKLGVQPKSGSTFFQKMHCTSEQQWEVSRPFNSESSVHFFPLSSENTWISIIHKDICPTHAVQTQVLVNYELLKETSQKVEHYHNWTSVCTREQHSL